MLIFETKTSIQKSYPNVASQRSLERYSEKSNFCKAPYLRISAPAAAFMMILNFILNFELLTLIFNFNFKRLNFKLF